MSVNNANILLETLVQSVDHKSFIRLTLSKPRDTATDLKKVIVKVAYIKDMLHFSCTYRHATKDITKNYPLQDGQGIIKDMIFSQFDIANLFTTTEDMTLELTPKGSYKLKRKLPIFKEASDFRHDKQKPSLIHNKEFLIALDILTLDGKVLKGKGDKLKQIHKFVEIIDGLIRKSNLLQKKDLQIYDMGSGKGYLTFALYDYLSSQSQFDGKVVGVEVRPDLINIGNEVASQLSMINLQFQEGYINDYEIQSADVLIALHACDTATDDAIYKGIKAGAKLIVCSPCCHKQVRKVMASTGPIADITTHGILAERQAELVTDAIRSLLLESQGYKTKVFEFISTQHTSKNLMIVGEKVSQDVDQAKYIQKVKDLKAQFGVETHYLETLLAT